VDIMLGLGPDAPGEYPGSVLHIIWIESPILLKCTSKALPVYTEETILKATLCYPHKKN